MTNEEYLEAYFDGMASMIVPAGMYFDDVDIKIISTDEVAVSADLHECHYRLVKTYRGNIASWNVGVNGSPKVIRFDDLSLKKFIEESRDSYCRDVNR